METQSKQNVETDAWSESTEESALNSYQKQALQRVANYQAFYADELVREAYEHVRELFRGTKKPFVGGTFSFIGDTPFGVATVLVKEAIPMDKKTKPRSFILWMEGKSWRSARIQN